MGVLSWASIQESYRIPIQEIGLDRHLGLIRGAFLTCLHLSGWAYEKPHLVNFGGHVAVIDTGTFSETSWQPREE